MSGLVLYWVLLLAWVAVVAYFIIFDLFPLLFGHGHGKKDHGGGHGHGHDTHVPEAPTGYSIYDGFKSFADKDGKLTPNDIVKGLSREEKDT